MFVCTVFFLGKSFSHAIVFFSMKFFYLYGNDSNHCLKIDVNDLHPASRLRSIIEKDYLSKKKKKMTVNIDKNMLKSLVASYRHNKFICKGDTSYEELIHELDRDCVSLTTPINVTNEICYLCEYIATDISNWQRMNFGMSQLVNGCKTEWCSSSSACLIQFATKPKLECKRWQSSTLQLLKGICMYILERTPSDIKDDTTDDTEKLYKHCISNVEVAKQCRTVHFMMNECRCSKKSLLNNLISYIVAISATPQNNPLVNFTFSLFTSLPNVSQIFSLVCADYVSPEQQCLNYYFNKNGYRIVRWFNQSYASSPANEIPLVYPTDWLSQHSRFQNPTFILEKI